MKGKLKCFGLLLVLAITLGLSLSVSSNANALKYEITTIPFGQLQANSNFYSYGWSSPFYDRFLLQIPSGALDRDGNAWQYVASKNVPHFYNLNYDANDGECKFDNNSSSWNNHNIAEQNSDTYYWWFPYYDDTIFDYDFQGSDVLVPCNKIGAINNIDLGSWPGVGQAGFVQLAYLKDYVPYRYNYNGIYAQDLNTQDGLYRQHRFMFESLFGDLNSVSQTFGKLPDRFTKIWIPFGIFAERNVTPGTSMELVGKFSFDSDEPLTSVFTLSQDFYTTLDVKYADSGGSSTQTVTCNYNLIDNRANESEYPYFLEYSCPFTTDRGWDSSYPESSRVMGFTLRVGAFEYSKMIHFGMSEVYFITNNDLTPAGKAFSDYTIDGSAPQDAPGSALDPSAPTDIDWIDSLSNLFSFQLFNPFSGFFLLFTDNSGCVNIPIIAGMLHSESDTYCPWFSADTRNIMTPVIGILATMFVFGFIVRWLKSTNSDFSPESSKGGD